MSSTLTARLHAEFPGALLLGPAAAGTYRVMLPGWFGAATWADDDVFAMAADDEETRTLASEYEATVVVLRTRLPARLLSDQQRAPLQALADFDVPAEMEDAVEMLRGAYTPIAALWAVTAIYAAADTEDGQLIAIQIARIVWAVLRDDRPTEEETS